MQNMHNAGMVWGRLCWVVWGFYVVGVCRCESRGMKKRITNLNPKIEN